MRSKEEDAECYLLAKHLEILKKRGIVQTYAHINNEVWTKSWTQKRRIKDMGSPAGLPDYIIVIKNILIFIEMKKIKGGKVSPAQQEWLNALQAAGEYSFVCNGFEEAKKILDSIIRRAAK